MCTVEDPKIGDPKNWTKLHAIVPNADYFKLIIFQFKMFFHSSKRYSERQK